MTARRFPVRFTGANKAMGLLGLRPASCYVEVDEQMVLVRMGPTFVASIPRDHVVSAADDQGRVWGWGVHGGFGTWLVNGSSGGIVRVEVAPAIKARLLGIPVTLRVLRVAVEDPAGLCGALAAPVPM